MADYGTSDTSTTSLGTNQFPISEVYVPNDALRALEGGPVTTDGAGKKSAPASMYVKDGGDTAQGTTTDAAYVSGAGTVIALLKKLVAELAASLTITGTVTEANSAALLVDTADIEASVANIPPLGQALAAASVPVVLTAAQQTALTPPSAIAGFALEAGHLSAIDTSTSASKTDLDALNTVHGAVSDAAWSGAGNGSIVAILKKLEAVLAATLVVSGSVSISNFPGTQPVSGTFWQATQPISGSVSVSNFPATQPVSGTFWQATQPVSAASLPLPTGAATLAKQPALGTAGTASTDVLSVQGIASMTPLKVDNSAVTQPANITQVSGSAIGTSNPLPTSLIVGGAVVSAGNPMPMGPMGQATMVNSLSVAIASNQSAVPVSGTFWQATQPVSGTVTMNAGAGTMSVSQLASGSVSGTLQSAVGATGNGATLNVLGMAHMIFVVSGVFVGTVTFEGTADGSNWSTITTSGGGVLGNTATAPGNFGAAVAGLQAVRARVSAYTSGAITVTAEAVPVSSSTHTINVAQIGGTAMALGQTVKASSVPVTLASDQSAVPVSGTFWQSTQPISGTITANAGTGNFTVTQVASQSVSATLQTAQAGNANGSTLTVLGMSANVFTVNMAAFTGTVNFEGSADGTNFSALSCTQLGTTLIGATTVGSTTTAITLFECSVGGLQLVRARTSGVSAGNVTVTAQAVPVNFAPRNINANQAGAWTITANAGTNLNTSLLALESGGHLATIDTHTPALGQALAASSVPVVLTAIQQTALTPPAAITGFALEAGHLATIDTSTANIPAKGQATMANSTPVVIASNQSAVPVSGTFWQTTQPVSQATAANLNATATIQAVTGTSLAVGSNALPTLNSAAAGYVAAYGSNPANTGTASTDATFKWGAGGTTSINHLMLQNNSGVNLLFELDTASTSGSPILATGQTIFFDVQMTALHVQSANANVPFNAAAGIIVKAWL